MLRCPAAFALFIEIAKLLRVYTFGNALGSRQALIDFVAAVQLDF